MKFKTFTAAGRYAWKTTFIPYEGDRVYPSNYNFVHYFLGYPQGKNRAVATLFYFLLGGFIFTPLKNILKLCTEFPLALMRYGSEHYVNRLKILPILIAILPGILTYPVFYVSMLCHLLVSTVTSPVRSAREAARIHASLGILSVLVSIAGYTALTILLAPVIVTLASAVAGGAGTAALTTIASGSGAMGNIAAYILLVLSHLGFNVVAAPMVGAGILAAWSAVTYALNSVREYFTELPSKPSRQKHTYDVIDVEPTPTPAPHSSWVDMTEAGLQKAQDACNCSKKPKWEQEFFGSPLASPQKWQSQEEPEQTSSLSL